MLSLLEGSSEVHGVLRLCVLLGQLPSFCELLSWAVDSVLKSKDIILLQKSSYSQKYGIPSCHIWMLELVHKEG